MSTIFDNKNGSEVVEGTPCRQETRVVEVKSGRKRKPVNTRPAVVASAKLERDCSKPVGVIKSEKVAELKLAEPFSSLFPINDRTLQEITENIKLHGFDPGQPVIVWSERQIVVDGHTRLKAARAVGLTDIPAVCRSFADENAAVDYAIHCQRNRRNLKDADILRLVEQMDKRRQRGGDHKSPTVKSNASSDAIDRSATDTAKKLGISTTKVEKARRLNECKDASLQAEVAAGQKTLNAAVTELRERETKVGEAPGPSESTSASALLEAGERQLQTVVDMFSTTPELQKLTHMINRVIQIIRKRLPMELAA